MKTNGLTFSGMDGSGKSTLLDHAAKYLHVKPYWKRNYALTIRIINFFSKWTGHNQVMIKNGQKIGFHNYNNYYKFLVTALLFFDLFIQLLLEFSYRRRYHLRDRGLLDFVIDLSVSTRSPNLIFFVSYPFLYIYLRKSNVLIVYAKLSVIKDRRPDVAADPQRFLRQFLYSKCAEHFKLDVLNTSRCSLEACKSEVLEMLS